MEKVLLVIAEPRTTKRFEVSEITSEMQKLIRSCGGVVKETVKGLVDRPSPSHYLRKGKLAELKSICEYIKPDLVVFSRDLTPTQMRNLEKLLRLRIVDRTGLILDIFAYHAKTREGKLQIELAQLNYTLPRLSDIWEEFSRLGGGIGTRGPGEQKLEVDRRKIRKKITKIKKDLELVRAHRSRVRAQRKRNDTFVISLVGYTNAGKSTLLNQMTGAKVLAEDKLFATLDPTTRRIPMKNGQTALLTDTVGFLKNLPHSLIEAFKATLEEIKESDLIFEVVDVTDQSFEAKSKAVDKVLKEIEAEELPRVKVFNKVDLFQNKNITKRLERKYPSSIFISAKTGNGTEELIEAIERYVHQEV